MNIAVIGLGHVGLTYALLFASKYKVVAYDIDSVKINNLKKGILPSKNEELMKFFCENNLNITFFDTFSEIKNNIDYYIIALPTDYDEKIGSFNTYEIEQTVSKILRVKPNGKIILKSTVPIGFSNTNRKQFIVKQILERKPKIVGIYKLGMKYNSDNYKESAILSIINELLIVGIKILVYEPNLNVSIDNVIFEKNFELFTKQSDLIVANRWDRGLEAYKDKVYTRGIWIRD